MKSVVTKWGNSLAIRIPKAFAEQLQITSESTVDLHIENDTIVISKALTKEERLKELLKLVTPENIHPETDWGEPVGKEIW